MSDTNASAQDDPMKGDRSSPSDPRDAPPHRAEREDPHSGTSDDPRVDPTPDRRQSS